MPIEGRGALQLRPLLRSGGLLQARRKEDPQDFRHPGGGKGWRADAEGAVRRRTLRAPTSTTVAEAAEAWLEGARKGTVRNRSGDRYKPSALRGYERSLRLRVIPALGHARLADVTRGDVQALVDKLLGRDSTRAPSGTPSTHCRRCTAAPSRVSRLR